MIKFLSKIFRKPEIIMTEEEKFDRLMNDILSDPHVKLEMELRRIGFYKLSHGSRNFKDIQMRKLMNNMTIEDYNKFTNYEAYGSFGKRMSPIYFYNGDFFISTYNSSVWYITEDNKVKTVSNIFVMKFKDISRYLGQIGDKNLLQFTRQNKLEELLGC